jgi:hypothetical protein
MFLDNATFEETRDCLKALSKTSKDPALHDMPSGSKERSSDAKLFNIAMRFGRLGNRLILFAHCIGFVEEHGHRLTNCAFHSYAGCFDGPRRDIYCRYPLPARRSWFDAFPGVAGVIRKTRIFYRCVHFGSWLNERHRPFGGSAVTLRESGKPVTFLEGPEVQAQIQSARCVFINGFNFQATRCVQRHAEKIRAYFRPITEHQLPARELVDRLRANADLVVGVHIRQGDYRRWRGGKAFFPVERYAAWMGELATQFPASRVSFLVCSDEARDQREFPGLRVGFGTQSAVTDLYALSECDYIFGPPSTFSKWASFYGNKPLFHLSDNNVRLELNEFRVSYLD